MTQQLTFDLPSAPALGRGDFFVSGGNAAAVEAIQSWHDWPMGKLVLVGPEGAGKTHLAHVWAAMTDAMIVPALELDVSAVETLAAGPVAVEDVDRLAGDADKEAALFHLHNLALAEGGALLITARTPPARWGLELPDLKSRMQGAAMVSLSGPNDALLSAVMVKLFNDRQVALDADVLDYLVSRMDRSFAGALRLVDALDQEALAQKRRITKQLAGPVLDKLACDQA